MTSPEGKTPGDQPDLGKAAKDFWAAAKAKAKEVGGKAAEKAKDVGAKAIEEAKHVQDTGQPGKAPADQASNLKTKALDIWRRAPTLVVVSGIGILVLCSSCCICTGVASLLFKSPDGSTESSRGVRTPTGQITDLRKQLLDTARRMDGDFVEVVADIVDAVETGDQPWSVADKRMYEFRPGYHQFASETIAAYERWKEARISAER